MKQVDIVITTYNRLSFLKLVFECIESQNEPDHYKYIIADAGSTDGTQEYLHKKFTNKNNNVLLMHSNKGKPMPLQDVWQMCLPAIEHSIAKEFVMCDDDVLCYGKNFIQELRSAMYEYDYDVLAPRSPNITQPSLDRKPYSVDRGVIVKPNLMGTHYRLHKKEKMLDSIQRTFNPKGIIRDNIETNLFKKIIGNGCKVGFYLPLPVFDIGDLGQSYMSKKPLPDDNPQIKNAKEFLNTGWSHLYGPEKILEWDRIRGIK